MAKDKIESGHAQNQADNQTQNQPISKRHKPILDWKYWVDHPAPLIILWVAAMIPSFVMQNTWKKRVNVIAIVAWLIVTAIGIWLARGIGNLNEPTDEELVEKQREEVNKSLESLKSSLTGVEKTVSEHGEKLKGIEQVVMAQGQRVISPDEETKIVAVLSAFHGQKFSVLCLLFDTEASRYAQEFIRILKNSGWEFTGLKNSTFALDFDNVQITINEKENGTIEKAPKGSVAMVRLFGELGIVKNDGVLRFSDGCPKDEIQLWIGAKKPVTLLSK